MPPASSTRSPRFFWVVIAVLVAAAFCGAVVGYYNYIRGPVVETLRAARLAPLPRSAEQLTTHSTVNGDAYHVEVRFHAAPADVDRWVQMSPSLRGLQPSVRDGQREFALPPSGSAKAVRVDVDDAQGQVMIALDRG